MDSATSIDEIRYQAAVAVAAEFGFEVLDRGPDAPFRFVLVRDARRCHFFTDLFELEQRLGLI